MRLAAIDLGSNSIKLLAAEVRGRAIEVLDEDSTVTRVGEGLDLRGELLPAAMDRTLFQLKSYAERAQRLGVHQIRCVGTAGLRGARNVDLFLDRARTEAGVEIEVIAGLREAELAFRAPAEAYGPGPVIVSDVGGRSTEVIAGRAGAIEARVSFEIGSVRMTERFFTADPPTEIEVHAARAFIDTTLRAAPDPKDSGARLIGVSGTVLALLGLQLGVDDIKTLVREHDGASLERTFVERALADLRAKPAKDRVRGTVLPPGRADVIVAGTLIVLALLERYRADRMIATHRGVRYGLIYEMAAALSGGA
jgi:exopolyphosphatase/guanosine-5'-triphosphate,3'-diphosphate pyrophosphatase